MNRRILLMILFCLWGLGCSGRPAADTLPLSIHTAQGDVALVVEVADTDAERSVGLMNRQELPTGRGMLFVFAGAEPRSFWMQNTYISLDLLFVSPDKEILYIEAEATPLSTELISPDVAAQYVLEVPGGFAAAQGIAVGDRLDFVLDES